MPFSSAKSCKNMSISAKFLAVINSFNSEQYSYSSVFSKLLGLGFTILYFFFYPLIIIMQKIFISNKLTTGYFVKAIK